MTTTDVSRLTAHNVKPVCAICLAVADHMWQGTTGDGEPMAFNLCENHFRLYFA